MILAYTYISVIFCSCASKPKEYYFWFIKMPISCLIIIISMKQTQQSKDSNVIPKSDY